MSTTYYPSSYADSSSVGLLCNVELSSYVYNLTYAYGYVDQGNEGTMVVTSVIMFLLAALFFNLNLFSRPSDVSAILNPTVRLFLSSSLSLFLPVMSYLFSEAKKDGVTAAAAGTAGELSVRARTILMWMLLVELLRKKVEATLGMGMQWYSSTIDRAARIAWLGYLVFYNLRSTGKKAVYGTLWVFAASKLVERVAINELVTRSFAYGKNAKLLYSYMASGEVLTRPVGKEGSELLKSCKYAVMGEDGLERRAGPKGYSLVKLTTTPAAAAAANDDSTQGQEEKKYPSDSTTVVTVGDIWSVEDGKDGLVQGNPRLRMLCFSFSLYKLLRRKFEDLSITDQETAHCRDIIFNGICKEAEAEAEVDGRQGARAPPPPPAEVALFQVLYDETQFLCEYYNSVLPVVLSNPLFFLANYVMLPIVVWALCLLTSILCGNGDVAYTLQSITSDNYFISAGTMRLAGCLLGKLTTPVVLFSTIDLATTMLLLLTVVYEQVWELVVFVLSNWLTVSLVCEYTAKRQWRESRLSRGVIRRILWVRSKMSYPNLCFKQFSVLGLCRLTSMALPTTAVPTEVKRSILEHTVAYLDSPGPAAPRSNGWCILQQSDSDRHRACESDSVAEVILTWHIATSLMEATYPPPQNRKVATTLSKYCAYLVALYPELLPDDTDGTERVYKDMVTELKKEMGGCWRYHLSLQRTRYDKLIEIGAREKAPMEHPEGEGEGEGEATSTLHKGARLGKILIQQAAARADEHARERVWELLADLWTELVMYVAPSSGEVQVKAHKQALARGGEFVTVLWALATHTGITRPAVAPWQACHHDHP